MSSSVKKRLGLLVRVLVSAGILAYLFNGIFQKEAAGYFEQAGIDPQTLPWGERTRIVWTKGPNALWEVFQEVDPVWFAAAVACMGLVSLLCIIRWRWILAIQGIRLSLPRAGSIHFIGLFFNAFMLGSTGGDVVKAVYAAMETRHKKAEAVATVLVDRLVGLLSLFVVALIMMGLFYHRVFDDPRLRTFALVTLAVVVGTVVFTFALFWKGLADKLPPMRAGLLRLPFYATLKRMVDAYRVYAMHPRLLWQTTLISFGVHFFSMLAICFVGRGLVIESANGWIDYFLYLPIINAVTAIPISISGFGVRELMYAQMFGTVGVSASAAVALSLLGYFASLFWSVVGSVFYLTHRQEVALAKQQVATEPESL
ncbi:MAG: lysylphosphatidylglycerol synthase transmembrane domain-containing protein [Verrucomicrobiae bacterium]|nr:lysylphosphatidylglycerol synthase transmembrane domain-containing protein [Verrucomicrobiae bacterium]